MKTHVVAFALTLALSAALLAESRKRKVRSTETPPCLFLLTDTHGNVTYPAPPGKYKKNQHCTWSFPISGEQGLLIEFFKLNVMKRGKVCDDFLLMPDGKQLCGEELPLQCYGYHGPTTTICLQLDALCHLIAVNFSTVSKWVKPSMTFVSNQAKEGTGIGFYYHVVDCMYVAPATIAPPNDTTTGLETTALNHVNSGLTSQQTISTSTTKKNVPSSLTTKGNLQQPSNMDLIIPLVCVLVVVIILAVAVGCLLYKRRKTTANTQNTKPKGNHQEGVYAVADDVVAFGVRQGNGIAQEDTYAECGPAAHEYGVVDNRLYEHSPPPTGSSGESTMVKNILYDPVPAAQLRQRASLEQGNVRR